MNERTRRALAKWPNVPALYGWLALDRRGRWRLRGELITHPHLVDSINQHYAADAQGRWYFQNGPQRGYVSLEYAPLVLRASTDGTLLTHTGRTVTAPGAAYLDETGALLLQTEHGPGVLDDQDLGWALARLSVAGTAIDEDALAVALALPCGSPTALQLDTGRGRLPVVRLDAADAPARLGFVREPQP